MNGPLPRFASIAVTATLLAALVAPTVARAWDATYVFTARGSFETYTGNAGDSTVGDPESISGAVTFRVLRVPPPDGSSNQDGTHAYSWNEDWVLTDFSGETSHGALDPAPFDAPFEFDYVYEVHQFLDPLISGYSNQGGWKQYRQVDGSIVRYHEAFLNRFMYLYTPWYSGLDFDPGFSPQYNYLYRGDYWIDYSSGGANWHGTNGLFVVGTWSLASINLGPLAESLVGTGPGNSLAAKVREVQAYYDAGDRESACTMLADFTRQISVLKGKKLAAETASKLASDAGLIARIIGCD